MNAKIEKPRIFISYAWASKAYEEKVLAFATQLVGDGIEVVIDKWDMTEGNDTYSFMERCVNDDSITNVLMLIDPVYAKKANAHTGGVGTETQIISAKVYQEVTQDRFIPIVFERDEDGAVQKPAYLEGRLHFDLTDEETYDDTYRRLVKKLYGEEVYPRPKLGTRPAWVDQPTSISPKVITSYDILKKNGNERIKNASFIRFTNEIMARIIEYTRAKEQPSKEEEIISTYDETQQIRQDYLTLLTYSLYVDNSENIIASCFENTSDSLNNLYDARSNLARIFIHELFIYTIAHFWFEGNYKAVAYLLNHSYFTSSIGPNDSGARNYHMFYSGSRHEALDLAVRKVTGKNYHSGTAQHWITEISSEHCSKERFVFADLLCFNYAVYGNNYFEDWAWFPVTYCYDNEYNGSIARMAHKLISKEYVETIIPVFGFEGIPQFVEKFKKVQDSNKYADFRYSGAFESAPILSYYIKADRIASLP